MKALIVSLLVLLTIPFGAYGFREILRIPRRKIGLPLAPEVLQKEKTSLAQRLYWRWMNWLGMDTGLHREIALTGRLTPGEHVMDIGAGTGELALLLKTVVGPEGKVSAIDINEHFLVRCRHRSRKFDLEVNFQNGNAAAIPFEPDSLDAVTCSLMAHHLTTELKEAMFREIRRVLKPGGRMIFFDLARPRSFREWYRVWTVLWLDLLFEWHCAAVNLRGEMAQMIENCGYEVGELKTHFMQGVRCQFIIARKPAPTAG